MEDLHLAGQQPMAQREDQRFTASGSRGTVTRTVSLLIVLMMISLIHFTAVSELVPVFSSIGRIYELRLMLEFCGSTRYVQFRSSN